MLSLVKVGIKVSLMRDKDNKLDKSSVKAVVSQNRQFIPVGHCDVMTRDAICEILDKNKTLVRFEGVICDFDEEAEDPPVGMFIAQIKVAVVGHLIVIDEVASYLNQKIKEFELDFHFYNIHPHFSIRTLEMIEEEEFGEFFKESQNGKRDTNKSENAFDLEKSLNNFNETALSNDFRKIFNDAIPHEELDPLEPSALMKTKLLLHQKIGLRWMVNREKKKKDKSLFWKKVESDNEHCYWENEITGKKVANVPEEFKGGILADEMGLGKTIQTISLIATSNFGEGPTLIVCPVSVMNTWLYQIEEHVEKDAFKAIIYHGPNRNTNKEHLEDFDIVITSYSIVSFEWTKFGPTLKKLKSDRKASEKAFEGSDSELTDLESSLSSDDESDFEYSEGVHSVRWFRVVLDEAHKIRSRKSKKHKAICSLWTDRRWCLTGTPVQNKLDDLYALIRFLQVHPLIEIKFWKSVILNKLKFQDPEGLKRLWSLREYILLRRTKQSKINGKLIVNLPEKHFRDVLLEFNEDQAKSYSSLSSLGKQSISRAEMSFGSTNVFIFAIITRMRQYCCHSQLLPNDYMQKMTLELNLSSEYKSIDEAFKELLDGESVCAICDSPSLDPCVTKCFHVFCKDCLFTDTSSTVCPVCNKKVDFGSTYDPKAAKVNGKSKVTNQIKNLIKNGDMKSSPKIEFLLQELKKNFDSTGRKDKSVIFSQWVSMLDIIEYHLQTSGITTVRIDGARSTQSRDLAYRSFQSNEDVTVILISLGAGGEGINLTAANRVFLIDPWWNPATEDQAIDRVHRLGQTRDVLITRLYMKNSIEEKVKELQERKRQLVKGTFARENSLYEQRILLSEIKSLFK